MMNDIKPISGEAPITFGSTKMDYIIRLYELLISYPDEEIVMAAPDVKACFRYPRIHPDLTGAFIFVIGSLFFLATAMVFGSVTSASSWEPFRRAIMAMAQIYFVKEGIKEKHTKYLDMLVWYGPP